MHLEQSQVKNILMKHLPEVDWNNETSILCDHLDQTRIEAILHRGPKPFWYITVRNLGFGFWSKLVMDLIFNADGSTKVDDLSMVKRMRWWKEACEEIEQLEMSKDVDD